MASPSGAGSLSVAVAGAGGYVGGELLGLLAGHPAVGKLAALSDTWAGQPAHAAHPRLLGREVPAFVPFGADRLLDCDAAFFATPHAVASRYARQLLEAGKLVIDCSPDFRLRDLKEWERWYGQPHPEPDLVAQAAYGLPELFAADIAKADLIAVPGCYATCIQLAAAPLVRALAAEGCRSVSIFAAGMSGTSGAGRRADRPELLLAEAGNNASAYALGGHRHSAEVIQGLQLNSGIGVELAFVPHLLPLPRGMIATLHIGGDCNELTAEQAAAALAEAYRDEPFVEVLDAGQAPQLASVLHTNRAVVGTAADGQPAIAVCAIDNLLKGAAGQAVQCLNLRLNLAPSAGLPS